MDFSGLISPYLNFLGKFSNLEIRHFSRPGYSLITGILAPSDSDGVELCEFPCFERDQSGLI
jgi:homogentisate 1,2-dioxygenase